MNRKAGMPSGQRQRQREIFLGALGRSAPAARRAFLQTACQGDEVLRRQVEALLREQQEVGDFLETPASDLRGAR